MFLKFPNSAKLLKTVILSTSFTLLLYLVVTKINITEDQPASNNEQQFPPKVQVRQFETEGILLEKYPGDGPMRSRIISDKIKRLGMVIKDTSIPELKQEKIAMNFNSHIFYYCPVQWTLPDNDTELNVVFYPELGLYNCTEDVIRKHFSHIADTGIGVVLVSWSVEERRKSTTDLMFKIALRYGLKISFVLEHYSGRTVEQIRNQVKYLIDEFSHYTSLNRVLDWHSQEFFPLFYIKESKELSDSDWRKMLSHKGEFSLRHTKYDGLFISQVKTKEDLAFSRRANFDGFFTFSASNGITWGSTWKNWHHIEKFADQYKMLFVPTVGPGYNEKIWKNHTDQKTKHASCRHRSNGNYYGVAWRTAIQMKHVQFVSVSSFNNWVEGTQIEQAIPRENFQDYSTRSGNYSSSKYLDLTKYWIGEFVHHALEKNQHFCSSWLNNTCCFKKN